MTYTIQHIADILGLKGDFPDQPVSELLFDSRKLRHPETSLFFALKGGRRHGQLFVPELYRLGLRFFVVDDDVVESNYPGAFFLKVNDSLQALQQLAAWHRHQFSYPVVGITGSNGKTIVKEWLYQALHRHMRVTRSPRSYNSQIGVPLSIWQMDASHELAIIEAGISAPGEMARLEEMIRPDIGVLTNIGEAHDEGFDSQEQKIREKLKLFDRCPLLIGRHQDLASYRNSLEPGRTIITWGWKNEGDWTVKKLEKHRLGTRIWLCPGSGEYEWEIPFSDDASIENAITCFIALQQLGLPVEEISESMRHLQQVDMRLQLVQGINHCHIINDSYSADLNSLRIALDFMQQRAGEGRKTVILSDLQQSSHKPEELYPEIIDLLWRYGVHRFMGIGPQVEGSLAQRAAQSTDPEIMLFPTTAIFLQQMKSHWFRDETVLVKGSRLFAFEQIVGQLELKAHQTVLEINLNAVAQNVKAYQQLLRPGTKIMAMVKAFAYGSGAEVAGLLQYHKVDYFGVAYADEGVELRVAGIHLPVMVMNPEWAAFDQLVENNLQPVLFSMQMLDAFEAYLEKSGKLKYPVHLEVETGMHRLGFAEKEWPELARRMAESPYCQVESVFSHLAASEDRGEDAYTRHQFDRFMEAVKMIGDALPYPFLRHLSNTAAISRWPDLQLDMVRLGIGMYGIDSSGQLQDRLLPAATLRSSVAQIKELKAGDTVGYNRRGRLNRDTRIATVRIGYADGFPRNLGWGQGEMWIRGHRAPVLGSVCMDMTMLDVGHIPDLKEGDDVIVFGKELSLQEMAEKAGTIPYEIMTGISHRVKRVYFEE